MTVLSITNAHLFDPDQGLDGPGTLIVEGNRIAAVGDVAPRGDVIDAGGLHLSPGLIDMRVTTGEPGRENRETIASVGMAAAAGGVSTVVLSPDTDPVIDDQSLVGFLARRGVEKSPVNILPCGALTRGLDGRTLTELGLMGKAGAVMFSNGNAGVPDARILRRILSYSTVFDALVAVRCAEPSMVEGTMAHESDLSARLGLSAHPGMVERIGAARDTALAELTGARLLVDLVSSADALPPIRDAQARDVEVAASVSINHLALNEVDIGNYRTFAKLDPPLRGEADRQALLHAVEDGTLGVIVSDHTPLTAGSKRLPFAEAAPGAVGVELLLGLGLTLAADDQIDLASFIRATTTNPATLLGLEAGKLTEGAPADLVLYDPMRPWVCDGNALVSLSNNTPFDGRRLTGRAVKTWVGGKLVFELES